MIDLYDPSSLNDNIGSVSMNKKISTALFILAVFLINTKSVANNISHEQDYSYQKMTGSMIERELADFQDAIALQEENGWTSPYMIADKIDDVQDGIARTFVIASEFDYVTRTQESLFRKFSVFFWGRDGIRMMNVGRKATIDTLKEVFEPYDKGEWPYKVYNFTLEERQNLIQLSKDLDASSLGKNTKGYYKGDMEFTAAVRKLHTLQKGEEGTATAQSVSP